jgi:hypothetical protein
VLAVPSGIETEEGPGVMDVVANERDYAVSRRERPAQVEEVLAITEAMDFQPARFIEDGGAVGFPDETGVNVGPGFRRFETRKGYQADPVAEGRAIIAGLGFNAAVEAVVEAEVPLPSFDADGVGEPERTVVGIGLGLLDEHVPAARAAHRPVVDHIEIRTALKNEGLSAADEDRDPTRGIVPRQRDSGLRGAGEQGNASDGDKHEPGASGAGPGAQTTHGRRWG